MKTTLARVEEKIISGKDRTDKHEKDIEKLKFWRNINVAAVLSALGITGFK